MAISNVTDWDEIEADPDFPSLSQESRAKLFDDWEKKFSRTLLEGADLDKVKPEGLNRLAATNAVRRRKLAGEDVSDLNVAAKTWSEQKQAEAKLAQQALKDYADVEDKKFRLDDARSMPGVDELGRAAPWWEEGVAKATKDLESAEAKLVPEVRAQAQAASEALKGKRKIATLNGNIYTDPALVLDKDEFRQQVLDSDAPPEAKALKLASFQNEKKRYLDEAINTLTKGDPQIPLAESFPKFLEAKGFDLDQEMVKQSEGKLDYSPIQKQRELAQEYLTKMQDRGWFRKIGSALSTGVASGMLDIGTQAVGTAAMLTGDEEKSKVAAELSRASGDIGAAQGLEGDMQATGGTFAGGVSRLGTNMAPMLLPGGAVGGIARLAGAGAGAATAAAVGASALTAGAQTAGSQFGEVYDHLRQQGSTHEQAFGVSRNAAVLSGAVTTALTALGGATGVESLLRQGGKDLVKSRLVAALKAVPGGAAKEIAEELPDEYVSQLVSAFAKDPNASPSQVTDEFAANAPDLILQIAALGGAGSGVGRFKETTTDPTKTAQEQEFPAAGAPPDLSQQDRDNFAQGGVPIFDTEGNVTGYTTPFAAETTASNEDIRKAAEEAIKPGIPVEVNGVTIATINPESGWNVQDVLDFANSPEDMATLARNKIITLPEAVAPIEGVDPAITAEMNARFAEGKAAGDANQTLAELERQKAAQTVDTEADIPEAQIAPTVGETAAPEVDISADTETLGVTPPPAPALEAPEGAARNAEMLRQAAARAAGTEQGPRIGFLQSPPAVTTETETPSNAANAAGGSQGVQTESAEGSVPTVTEDTVPISDIPSTAETKDEPFGKLPTKEVETELSRRTKQAEEEEAREKVEAPKRREETIKKFVVEGAVVQTRKKVAGRKKAAEGGGDITQTENFLVHPDKREIPLSASEAKNLSAQVLEPGEESSIRTTPGEESPIISDPQAEWTPTPGQPATANINGQKVVGTVGPSTGGGLVSFQYEWNGKPQKAVVRPERLARPVASLTEPPSYQYTQEQNTRKAGKHFPTTPGVHANHDFRKSFASMAEDTSLSRIYRQIAKVMSKMDAFANIDLHIVADGDIGYAGEYSHSNGKSSIAVNLRQVARGKVDALGTILHEALHHITLAKVRNPQGAFENDVVQTLDQIRQRVVEYAKQQGLDKKLDYEIGTNEEFISAIFTRPDFQNFLASIPDSFAPGVSVGRFRSVLSEIFRLLAELVTGEMVAKGSTMEQAMTTVLALFETPHRTLDIGKLEKLSAVQSGAQQETPESRRHAELEAKFNAGTITPEETAEAQRLVDERAKAAGYDREAFKAMPEKDWRTDEPINVIKSTNGPWAGFFTDTKEVADRFGRIMRQPVKRAFLKLTKPFEVDASGKAAGELQFDILDDSGTYAQKNNAEILAAISSGKYDAIVLKNTTDEGTVIVPLDPNQIKSADPFTGVPLDQRFDKESNDIRASLAEQPERRGYRTPADMLAEAAEKAKGERATEKPQGLASMFKPQAKRPATGERKLLDMPVRNTLANAYREAVRGSSTQMAPLSSVYAQARLLQPGLTPEAFLAQVQEGYDNGTLLLEGAGSQQEADAASMGLHETPVGTAVRMMPAPETPSTLYAAPIDTTQSNEPDAGTGGGRDSASSVQNGGASERTAEVSQAKGGGDTASVLARLDAAREAAVSAAVAESDWGNYTPEQKTEALNSFIRSIYGAADSSLRDAFRGIGGVLYTRGTRRSASATGTVEADGRLHLELTYDNSAGSENGVRGGASARDMFTHAYDTAQEEIIHAADKVAAFKRWEAAGRPSTLNGFEIAEGLQVLGQLNKARLDLQNTDPAAAQKIKDAMLASWEVYYGKPAAGIDGLFRHLEKGGNAALYLYELRRQLTQLKRQDFTTETGWQKFRRVLEKWLTDAINSLRGVQDVFRSGMAGDLIQRQLADLEAALEGKPLPPVSRGTPKSVVEEPDQRESDAILGAMMEDGRFEEGVKMYDKAKRANLGAPPQPSPNTSTPPRFTSPAQFAAAFEAAFLRGDYDYFLEALKQADRHIYVPEMKRYINASKLGDTDAAERLEWFRHAIAGTIPTNVKPQAKAPPQPASVGAPTTPPPPNVVPPPKAGVSNRPMLTLNTPAMGLIAKMLGASIRINTLLRRARGRIKLSMADGSEIELSKHLFKDPVQAAKTLAHEIGHLFDFLPASGFTKTLAHKLAPLGDFRKVFGNDLADWFMDGGKKIKPSKITQLIKPELIALSKKWRGDFSPSDKYRGSGKELYADFISAILNDPMWTAKNAPYATLGFLNALEQKPEVEQAYQLLVSLVQGGSLYKALAEADQGKSTSALERLIAKSSALTRAKKTLNDAVRGLYRSMFGSWLPTATRDGGIWKSYWKRVSPGVLGTPKDYNWAQEEASQFAVRQIAQFDNDMAAAVGIPLKLAGIDPHYLQRLQTNNRIIHERRSVGKLIEEDPVKARALLKWMVDAGLLGKDVQAEVDATADEDLYKKTAEVIHKLHASGEGFERALKAARRKGAPADAEKALYAFDVSGFMLNPNVHTMESAEADNADIEQTLGPDQFAELQRINEGYHDLIKRTMVGAYKLGLFRKSTWDDVIVPNFGVYVPFMPIKYFTGYVKGGIGPARVGTSQDLIAPHVVGISKMHALINRMQRQKQALLLIDFFNNTGLSNELEPVEDEDFDRIKAAELTKQSKHTISFVPYWDEGEYKWVKVNGTDAVSLMQDSDPDDLAALYQVLKANTRMWRMNFTIFSIGFNVANTLRNVVTPFVDVGPKAGYKAAKQLLSVFPQMGEWVWAKMAGRDTTSIVAASISMEHAMHKPGMPVSKELQEFYDRGILQPSPDVASLRMTQEELARSVMGALSSPDLLLHGGHKAAKDMNWFDKTLKPYFYSAVDILSFIGSVSEAAPKVAAYQALKEKKDSKGKPAFTDAQATYIATLEGIPRPGVSGALNKHLELVWMFFRIMGQSWRKHLIMATAPQTRAGFITRHMLFEGAKFGLQAMAANGAIDYLIALGAAAAAGGDDDDPEKYKQVDWAEAMGRKSDHELSHGGVGPLICWVLPDGSIEPPWGHKSIPADWVPLMPRLPGTELSREADPLAYYTTSKMLAPTIAPVNDDVFWNDYMRGLLSLNPAFEVVSDAMSVMGPTPPRDSYRGREKVEQRLWDEGYVARMIGLGEHHLKSFGLGSNPYDTPLPGALNVLKRPGFKTLISSNNMVGVREERRARHEDDLTSSFAQNMVGEKFNNLKKTFNRLKGKSTAKTPQETATYEVLKPIMSKAFYGSEKRDGLYDVLQSYARMKAKGLQDTPGGKLLKAEAEQAAKHLEKIADNLQKPLEFIRTHTLP
jgi:hypothetical protein